jgi:hypothetical protein
MNYSWMTPVPFYVLLTVHPCIILQIKPTWCTVLLSMLPDSHPYTVTNTKCRKDSYFSWWWAYSRPKHDEKRNKHTRKNCATSWLYLQDSCNRTAHKRPSLQSTMAHEQPICLTSKNVGNMHNMRVRITWKTVWQWRSFLYDSTNCLAHEPCVCLTSKRTTHENLRPWLLKPLEQSVWMICKIVQTRLI